MAGFDTCSNGSNQIRISGYDEDHLIHDITLENIRLGTVQLSDYDTEHFYVNEFAKSIRLISQSNPAGKLLDGPYYPLSEVHNAAEEFSVQQGENGWHYRTWQAGVGTYDMSWNPDGSGHWRGPKTWDAVWKSGDSLYMHPDETQILLEWVAPRNGSVDITGTVRKFAAEGGDGVTVSIWKNGFMLWPETGQWKPIAYNDTVGCEASVATDVSAGDILSFRVDKNGDTAYDTTEWTPVVQYRN